MNANLEKLLAGSPVSAESHPVLFSLLAFAAAGPGIKAGEAGDTPAVRKRILRNWDGVCGSFRSCLALGVTDADLNRAEPFPGLHRVQSGNLAYWEADHGEEWRYRLNVAAALCKAIRVKLAKVPASAVESVADLRERRKAVGLPSFTVADLEGEGRVETPLVAGGVVVSWMLLGKRLFVALRVDERGQVTAEGFRDSKAGALSVLRGES